MCPSTYIWDTKFNQVKKIRILKDHGLATQTEIYRTFYNKPSEKGLHLMRIANSEQCKWKNTKMNAGMRYIKSCGDLKMKIAFPHCSSRPEQMNRYSI